MIIDGKAIAEQLLNELRDSLHGTPILTVIQVGECPASTTYIRMKRQACERVGIVARLLQFPPDITMPTLLREIDTLNKGESDGILLQLPLPAHLDPYLVVSSIDPNKDVDGFHPINAGRLAIGLPGFVPCTPLGIQMLLMCSGIQIEGRRVVIVGRSQVVGTPLALLLLQKKAGGNATVTVAHSQTADLEQVTREADILVAAIGKARFITASMVKKGAVVIDVGINREDGKMVGDVDFERVQPHCAAISPVPGGVGPMTVAMLLSNTVRAWRQRHHRPK